jgi:hypothetical protein
MLSVSINNTHTCFKLKIKSERAHTGRGGVGSSSACSAGWQEHTLEEVSHLTGAYEIGCEFELHGTAPAPLRIASQGARRARPLLSQHRPV